jgi:hypothetical protein
MNELDTMRDKGTSIAHYSNLFISSTLTGIERGTITCPESNKMFLKKLADTTVLMIKSSRFIEDGDIFNSAEVQQSRPNRRSSLNMIPFARAESEFTFDDEHSAYSEGEDPLESTGELRGEGVSQAAPPAHRLIQMPDSLEEVVELMFTEFASMTHSREGEDARENNKNKFMLEMYMTKRNFLAMCLILDLIDAKLTLLAAKSCFEKYAFLAERGQRKFNNR